MTLGAGVARRRSEALTGCLVSLERALGAVRAARTSSPDLTARHMRTRPSRCHTTPARVQGR